VLIFIIVAGPTSVCTSVEKTCWRPWPSYIAC